MELLFDRDSATKTTQIFHGNDGDTFTIQDSQEVGNLLETNKLLRDSGRHHDRKSEFRRVASIPLNVWCELRKTWREQGLSWEEKQVAMKRWLNDRDQQPFRTDNTRV